MEDEEKEIKKPKFKEVKGYKSKIKRHRDAVLQLHSVDGAEGDMIISGSADHTVRSKCTLSHEQIVWNLAEQKLSKQIEVNRPMDHKLFKYQDN